MQVSVETARLGESRNPAPLFSELTSGIAPALRPLLRERTHSSAILAKGRAI